MTWAAPPPRHCWPWTGGGPQREVHRRGLVTRDAQARGEKLTQQGVTRRYELIAADLNEVRDDHDASVVIMNLTLQFVRPLRRQQLMASIAQGMRPDGCLLLIEKVLSRESTLNRFFIKYYYRFKQRTATASWRSARSARRWKTC